MNNQEAIDLLDNLIGMISDNQDSDYDEALKMGISALQKNESAEEWYKLILEKWDSAENKGEWQHDGSRWKNRFICSVCGYKLFDAPSNYCPNCGADMRGGE